MDRLENLGRYVYRCPVCCTLFQVTEDVGELPEVETECPGCETLCKIENTMVWH